MKRLKIVTLDCPYDTFDHQETQEFFSQMVRVRIRGYQGAYGYGVLPLDGTDFIGTHLLFCEEGDGGLNVISTMKSTSYSRCKAFNIPFPALGLAKSSQQEPQVRYVERFMESADAGNHDVTYIGGWTIDPARKKNDTGIVSILRELYVAANVQLMREQPAVRAVLIGGNIRFKTDQFFNQMGFEYGIDENGNRLPAFGAQFAFGEPVTLLGLHTFSESALALGIKYQSQWDNRIEIKAAPGKIGLKKAA
jgi:hypothetical protein